MDTRLRMRLPENVRLVQQRAGGPEYAVFTVVVDSDEGEKTIGACRLLHTTVRVPMHKQVMAMHMGRPVGPTEGAKRWEAGRWTGGRYGPLIGNRYESLDDAVRAILRVYGARG